MITWSQELLDTARRLKTPQTTYAQVAANITAELGIDIAPEALRSALRRSAGKVVSGVPDVLASITEPLVKLPSRTSSINREITFATVGDSHLCSNYARVDILEQLYDEFELRGISTVYHTGNYIDGEASFNTQDIHVHGIDAQCSYFIEHYPQRSGVQTLYIDGDDHEGWYTKKLGLLTGQHVEDMARRAGRNDLTFLGYMEANIALFDDGPIVKVLHPGGGSSYAISYTSQKIIDSYEDYEKPDIVLIGHYHKASLLPSYRGVTVIQTGCTQEPTPFMRKKRLHADLGGWVVTLGLNENNTIARINAEFISFPMKPWKYR